MKCPSPKCGSTKAYIGAYVVECPNPDCAHFSAKLRDEQRRQFLEEEIDKATALPYGALVGQEETLTYVSPYPLKFVQIDFTITGADPTD